MHIPRVDTKGLHQNGCCCNTRGRKVFAPWLVLIQHYLHQGITSNHICICCALAYRRTLGSLWSSCAGCSYRSLETHAHSCDPSVPHKMADLHVPRRFQEHQQFPVVHGDPGKEGGGRGRRVVLLFYWSLYDVIMV